MHLPTINYPTNRPNFTEVTIGDLTVWYSYCTPVAFHTPDIGRVVRENDWSTTTGKHLNHIDGGHSQAKKARVSGEEFQRRLDALPMFQTLDVSEVGA